MQIRPAVNAEPPALPGAGPPLRRAAPPAALGGEQTAPAHEPAFDRARLEQAAEQLNKTAAILNRQIHFQVHEATGRLQVRVVDSSKGDVVAEFPPEKLLDVLAAIREQVGLILDHVL